MTSPEGDRSIPDQLTLPTPEHSVTEESLLEYSIPKLEKIKRPELGMAGAAAHWGQKYEEEEIEAIIARVFDKESIDFGDTGFNEIYRVPEGYSLEQAFEEEMMMVKRLVNSTLKLNNWKPKQVDALYFGGSPLILPDYGYAIARATGLTHLDPKLNIFNYYLACNAGGRALKDALINPNLQEKNVLVIAVEGLTRQVEGFDKQKSDYLSMRFFSDGAAAVGVVPGKTLTHLLGESKAVEDKKGALAAVGTWRNLVDPKGDLIQVVENITMIKLPTPPDGKRISMQGWETAKLFLRNVPPVIEKVYKQHREQYPEKEIEMIVAHHPSFGVNELIKGKLKKMGIKTRMSWVVNDGNSSGATTLIAFVRLMEELNPGDHILVASFGAGISIDVFVAKIGGTGETQTSSTPP